VSLLQVGITEADLHRVCAEPKVHLQLVLAGPQEHLQLLVVARNLETNRPLMAYDPLGPLPSLKGANLNQSLPEEPLPAREGQTRHLDVRLSLLGRAPAHWSAVASGPQSCACQAHAAVHPSQVRGLPEVGMGTRI